MNTVLCEVSGEKNHPNPFPTATYSQPELTTKNRGPCPAPTSFKGFFPANVVYCTILVRDELMNFSIYFSMVQTKTEPMQEKHCENCIAQVVCWYSVWLVLLVLLVLVVK